MKPRKKYEKFQLRYMIIESCCDCNQTCVSGVAGDDIERWCGLTGTNITENCKGEGSFPSDCPLKIFKKEGEA